MKVKDIIIQIDEKEDNPLRAEARIIREEEFGTPYLKEVVATMQEALARESDGVALAAPQIALSLRIFVIAPSAYPEDAKSKPLVFINPKITKSSKKTANMQEGCLSVRWVYGTTTRSTSATVEAYDIEGKKFSYGGSGLIAHIFQHEVDHLNGTLFIDHGFDFEEYTEEEVKAGEKKNKN
ncbi:MAG: peptide deformylase [Candidatus Paceibacterota bacterium]